MKVNDNYVVFILSNGRPNEQLTLNMLKDNGYTGEYYIVCDDEDITLSEYKEKYGNNVLVFNKEKIHERTDTVDNFHKKTSAVYARNAIYDIAKEKNIKHFIMADDDITDIYIRFENDGKLKSKHVNNLDKLFNYIFNFKEKSGANTVSFGMGFDLIGGLKSKGFTQGYRRRGYCFYFCSTDKKHAFIGTISEDQNHGILVQQVGGLVFTLPKIQMMKEEEQDGGNNELYGEQGESLKYMRIFYSVVPRPDSVSVKITKSNIQKKKNFNTMFPKIIREDVKK